MPKFDLDKDESVFSPLEFTIDEKIFKVSNCSKKTIDAIEDKSLYEQFAILCAVDLKEVEELNVFKLRAAMAKFFDTMMKPIIAEAEALVALRDRVREKKKEKATKPNDKKAMIKKEKNVSGDGIKK